MPTPNKFIKAIGTDEVEIALEATPVAGEFDQDGNQVYIPSSGVTLVGGGDASATNQLAANVLTGPVTETAPATDTASSGLNGRLQRLAQRITSLIALLPSALGTGGGIKVDGSGTALPVSGSVTANDGQKVDAYGTAITGASMPAGGAGFLGWLTAIWKQLNTGITTTGTATISGTATVTADGAIITGETVETGGSGLLGWLSSIRHGITQLVYVVLGTTSDAAVGNATGSINAHLREIARQLTSPAFDVTDTIKRPNTSSAYAANQAINCDLTVTEVAYTGLVVTVKAVGHGLFAGTDTAYNRITVAGINTGATLTNVDGNWVATPIDADHFSFTVAVQPTGTTPQTGLTIAHAIAKMLSVDLGGEAGSGVLLSTLKLSLPGKGMTGAIRLYLDTTQVAVLVDATTYPLVISNTATRKFYFDFTPVTENASSDCAIAELAPNIVVKRAVGETRLYFRLVAEAAGTPTALGVVSLTASGLLVAL